MKNEIGWSFVAIRDGVEIVSQHEGWADRDCTEAWTKETLVPVWSATKGPMAVCVLMALHRSGMDGESEVRRVWPELKIGDLTFEEMFSHQAGLAGLHQRCSIWDREAVVASLEAQEPLWNSGTHGYHPRTIGFLADEIVQRTDGRSLGQFWREEIADENEIDFWIGLPEQEHHRVASLIPAKFGSAGEPKPFYDTLLDKASLTRLAFSSPSRLAGVSEMNQPKAWEAGFPAMGGVGSALGLAKFYDWVLKQDFLGELIRHRISGLDQIQRVENSFAFGMMLGLGPEKNCFGHPGAGGSYGLADPSSRTAYAFVMNHFESNLYPSDERLALISNVGID